MVQRIPGAVHHTGPGHILAGVPLSDDVNALFNLPISLKSYLRVIAALLSGRRTCTSINVKKSYEDAYGTTDLGVGSRTCVRE